MRILSETRLREFWQTNPASENAMREWIQVVKLADWYNFADLKNTFNHADIYQNCVIFDIGGNKFRLIAKVAYQKHLVFVRAVLTHFEYDKNKWCSDCE